MSTSDTTTPTSAADSRAERMAEIAERLAFHSLLEIDDADWLLAQRRAVARGRAVSRMIELYRNGELYPWYTPS